VYAYIFTHLQNVCSNLRFKQTVTLFIGGETVQDTAYYMKKFFESLFITSPQQLNMQHITEKLGIKIVYWEFSSAIAERNGKCNLFIDQRLTRQEQWQDFGHEMKHFCFDRGDQDDLFKSFIYYQEVKADYFAYHFCIPTFMLEQLKEVTANDVARIFNVEFDFAIRRLDMYKNNLITAAESCVSYD